MDDDDDDDEANWCALGCAICQARTLVHLNYRSGADGTKSLTPGLGPPVAHSTGPLMSAHDPALDRHELVERQMSQLEAFCRTSCLVGRRNELN